MVPKKFKKIIILLFIFGVINTDEAIKFEKYDIIYNIDQNDLVHGTIYLDMYNNNSGDISNITYILPQSINNLKVISNKNISSVSNYQADGSTKIIIDLKDPIKRGERCYLNISFDSDMIWDKNGRKMFSVTVPAVDSNFTMTVILPMGAAVVSPAEGLLSITPQDYTINTDGKRIYIEWKRELSQENKYFTATVSYKLQGIITSTNQSNGITDNLYYIILVIVLILIIIGSIYGIYYEKRKNTKKNKTIEELFQEKEKLNSKINNLLNDINDLKSKMDLKEDMISKLKEKNEELLKEISKLINELNEIRDKLNKKNEVIEELKNLNEDLNKKLEDCIRERMLLNLKIEELNKVNKSYEEELNALNELNNRNKKILFEREKTIEELNNTLKSYKETINNLKHKIENYEKTKGELLMNILTEDEKMVAKLIKEYGEITQKEIVNITGLTKPKISRIVADLEGRGIIKKIKFGRINKLTLSDEFRWYNGKVE